MICYTYQGTTLSESQLYKLLIDTMANDPLFQTLKYTIFNVLDDTLKFIEQSHNLYDKPQAESTSVFIDLEHMLPNSTGILSKRHLSPAYNLENRRNFSVQELLRKNPSMTRELALKEVNALIEEENGISVFGSLFHELVSTAINAHVTHNSLGTTTQEFAEKLEEVKLKILTDTGGIRDGIPVPPILLTLTSKTSGVVSIDEIMKTIVENVQKVENAIFNGLEPGCIVKSEYKIGTDQLLGNHVDEAGNPVTVLRGIIDCLIIHPNGKVDIIDFKVSTRPYNDWYAAKEYHTKYQLGTYRAILAANGLNGREVNLKTLPIYFALGKILTMTVDMLLDLTKPTATSVSKHLDWDDGEFSKNLRALIRVTISPILADNITLLPELLEDIEKMFGKFQIPENNITKLEKKNISIWPVDRNGETWYGMYDRITGLPVYKKTKEEFTRDGGYIDEMFVKLKKLHHTLIEHLVLDIKQYLALTENKHTSFNLLGSTKDQNVDLYNILNGTFGKYCNSNWQLIEIPELISLGILVFHQSSSGIFDVVRVTENNLRTEINIAGGSTVFGRFMSNEEAARMQSVQPLKASVENILLLETLAACNKLSDKLANGKLGSINIVNVQLGQRGIGSIHQLISNFNWLTNHAEITNNFLSKVIRIADTWEIIQECLSGIVNSYDYDERLKQIVSKLEVEPTTNYEKLQLIIRLMNILETEYSLLKKKNFREKRSFDTPQEKIYLVLSNALLFYRETPVLYDGKLSKWGLHFEEVIRILGTPFLSQYKGTLNNGYKAIGLGLGLDMGTPMSSASSNLSALFLFWNNSFQLIRRFTLDLSEYLNKITVNYFNRHGVSSISRAVLNSSSVWEQFIEKGPDGKYTKELKIIDPETITNSEDKLFLNQLLWEINKFILPIDKEKLSWRYEDHKDEINSDPAIIEAKHNGKYYQLPLRRATNFDRMRHIRDNGGIISTLKKYWNSFADAYDPRLLHTSAQRVISSEFGEATEMYNQYKISPAARQKIIETEGLYDFEIDLNLLALDVAFQNKRKELFDDCLTHAAAMATVFLYLNETSDANFDEELENLDDLIKVTLKNESPIPNELKETAKAILAAKTLNSLIVLGVRPLQFIKEITFGQFTNYSRVWALHGTSLQISASNLFKANMLIWGKTLAGWMKGFTGNEDLASFTFILKINKLYGMANEDLNQIVKNNSLSRTGLKHGWSKYMYIFNSAPDFFNRMSLFSAKMLEDGCLDAHYIDENGLLQYDIKKDKRFSKLVQLGLNSSSTDVEYLKQRALYRALIEQFAKEGYTKQDGSSLKITDPDLYLPRAYTNKEQASLKEIADEAYGFYDHEAKSLNDHKFIGLVFKLFMAFWTAKTRLWLKAPGSNTARGSMQLLMDGDKPLYEKIYEDENGNIIKELTTENPDGTLEPALGWQGDYVEGLIYSIGYTLHDIFTGKWSDIVENKARLGNLKLALHDILLGIILYNILRIIFSGGSGKMKDMNPAERTLIRALQDTSPAAIFGLSLTPSFVSTLENLKNDIPSLFTEDRDTIEFLRRRFGAIKDITWEQH